MTRSFGRHPSVGLIILSDLRDLREDKFDRQVPPAGLSVPSIGVYSANARPPSLFIFSFDVMSLRDRDRFDAFPLHPDTARSGREMAGFCAQRGFDLEAMYRRIKTPMNAKGLPYGRRSSKRDCRIRSLPIASI
jgi:hypothetical protein